MLKNYTGQRVAVHINTHWGLHTLDNPVLLFLTNATNISGFLNKMIKAKSKVTIYNSVVEKLSKMWNIINFSLECSKVYVIYKIF